MLIKIYIDPSYFTSDDGPSFLMEYCPLGNLHNYIVKNGPMSEHQIKKVLYHILSALSYLASKGIVHRDIKPDNILLTNDGSYKLCDFGNSYVLDARATSSSHP